MRRIALGFVVSLLVVASCPSAVLAADGEGDAVAYSPPIDAPIVDGFRPPAVRYGAGNRGIDYDTTPGDDVSASADGVVTFSGMVGLSLHVVVLHADGVRTSYSFLDDVAVRRGDVVRAGDVVGRAGEQLHFGARVGDDYVDPLALLGGRLRVRLVPTDALRLWSVARERDGLLAGLGRLVSVAGEAVVWAAGSAVALEQAIDDLQARLGREAVEVLLVQSGVALLLMAVQPTARRASDFLADQDDCTPGDVAPTKPVGRRIAVLVAGYGSGIDGEGGGAAVLDVRTEALGYREGDVAVFSYAGGQAPTDRRIEGIDVAAYAAGDSFGDIGSAGARLSDLLESVAGANPGVPIDVIAHSQGGLVARAALTDSGTPPVANLITLGTPHQGADLATAGRALVAQPGGWLLGEGIAAVSGLDPGARSVGQLAEGSPFLDDLHDAGFPAGTRVTSIAADHDLTVTALHSAVADGTNSLVSLQGVPWPATHTALPGSAEATREIALALNGLGPTCRSIGRGLATAAGLSLVEDAAGQLLTGVIP